MFVPCLVHSKGPSAPWDVVSEEVRHVFSDLQNKVPFSDAALRDDEGAHGPCSGWRSLTTPYDGA